jgi:hypothetical protein
MSGQCDRTIWYQHRWMRSICQDEALNKESKDVYSEGFKPSHRIKDVTPQWSSLMIKPIITITNQLKAASRLKHVRNGNKIWLIALIMTAPFSLDVYVSQRVYSDEYSFKANVFGAVRINNLPAFTFLMMPDTMASRSRSTV